MNTCKYILCAAAATACLIAMAEEPKKKAAPKSNANYRQSSIRKTTTITNPYALTAKKIKEDPEAAAAFKKLNAEYWKMVKAKDFDAIHTAIDDFLAKNKKLTPDQKSMVLWCKANTYYLAKDYSAAVQTAKQGINVGGLGAGRNAAIIIRAAIAEKNFKLADTTIANFEKSRNYADADFYNAAVSYSLSQKKYDAAFNFLKAFGKQPNLNAGNRAMILKGFGRCFMEKKRYNDAIAQYNAVKDIPNIDDYNVGDAGLQMATCYLKMNNKTKALEIYQSLTKSKNGNIRNIAQREIKKLTAKPAPAKKKPAPAKKKPAAKKK